MGDSLYIKLIATNPGKHARSISELLYNHGGSVKALSTSGKDYHTLLCMARDYLESLAMAEVRKDVPKWAEELLLKEQENGNV